MQTNFFPAEYGQTGGAAIQMVTKSGSNEFHGPDSTSCAIPISTPTTGSPTGTDARIPYFRRDQFGGVIGGPVIKNKTFFFATYENTKQKSPTTETADRSHCCRSAKATSRRRCNASGQMITIYNPFDTFINASDAVERRPVRRQHRSQIDDGPDRAEDAVVFSRCRTATGTITGTQQLVCAGREPQPQPEDGFQGRPQFQRQESLDRAVTASAGATAFRPICSAKAIRPITFNNGPNGTRTHSVVTDFTRVQNADHDLDGSLRLDLLRLLPQSDGHRIRSDDTRLPEVHEGQRHSRGVSDDRAGRLSRHRHRRLGDHGSPGRRPSVLRLALQDPQRAQPQVRRRNAATTSSTMLQPGYPSGRFAFGSQTTRNLQNGGAANLEGNGLASMLLGWGNGVRLPHRSEGLLALPLHGFLSSRTTGRSPES